MTLNYNSSLTGHLLLAMPRIGDPRFHQAVIFICVHDEKGAMGLTLNQPLPSPSFPELIAQLGLAHDMPIDQDLSNLPILSGGPVESVRGFLLHTPDFRQKDTIMIDDQFGVSSTLDSLKAMIAGPRPEHMVFTLGYAGWGEGQLDREMQDNAWLSVPATHELIFRTSPGDMWEKAFATLGINPAMLSDSAGRA